MYPAIPTVEWPFEQTALFGSALVENLAKVLIKR
jgi:hypothetical protein